MQLVQLVLWTTFVAVSADQDWAIAASAMSLFAALCIAMMLNTEHRRSIQPSTLLSIYFGITVFLDGIGARSYLLRAGLDAVGATQVVVTVAKFALLILEEVPKDTKLTPKGIRDFLGKEAVSGFWTRSLFLWLNEIFLVGFRQTLTINDLGNLEPQFSTEQLAIRFNEAWEKSKSSLTSPGIKRDDANVVFPGDKTKQHQLLRTMVKLHISPILLAAPPRILFAICMFAQPLLIYHIVDVVDRNGMTDADRHSLVMATAMVYGGIGVGPFIPGI